MNDDNLPSPGSPGRHSSQVSDGRVVPAILTADPRHPLVDARLVDQQIEQVRVALVLPGGRGRGRSRRRFAPHRFLPIERGGRVGRRAGLLFPTAVGAPLEKLATEIVVDRVGAGGIADPDASVTRDQVVAAVAQIHLQVHHQQQREHDGERAQAQYHFVADTDQPDGQLHSAVLASLSVGRAAPPAPTFRRLSSDGG